MNLGTLSVAQALEKIRRLGRLILRCLFDSLLLLIPRPLQAGSRQGKKRVLIVKTDAIGDCILWLDAARWLRTLYPPDSHHLTLVANGVWAELAETLPWFDELWPLDKERFFFNLRYRWRRLLQIRRASFDIALHPMFSREALFGDAIVRISGAPERIGSTGDFTHIRRWQKPFFDAWYTRLVPASPGKLMELDRNAEFLRGLGLGNIEPSLPSLPESTVNRALPLQTRSGSIPSRYFVLVPGALRPYRQWGIAGFREIARRIHARTGWHAVICGGPGEEPLGSRMALDADFPLTDRTGRTTLLELIGLIAGARLVVSNETGAVHIAAAVSTPAVCILGGGHYGRFMPYHLGDPAARPLPVPVTHPMDCFGCEWDCRFDVSPGRPTPCIERIAVDRVWQAVEPFLGER